MFIDFFSTFFVCLFVPVLLAARLKRQRKCIRILTTVVACSGSCIVCQGFCFSLFHFVADTVDASILRCNNVTCVKKLMGKTRSSIVCVCCVYDVRCTMYVLCVYVCVGNSISTPKTGRWTMLKHLRCVAIAAAVIVVVTAAFFVFILLHLFVFKYRFLHFISWHLNVCGVCRSRTHHSILIFIIIVWLIVVRCTLYTHDSFLRLFCQFRFLVCFFFRNKY